MDRLRLIRGYTLLRGALLLMLVAAALLLASAASSSLVSGDSKILFRATQESVPVDGSFRKFVADVAFDPAKPEVGRVGLTIDMRSVATGSSDADDLLKGKDFFDVARFAQASFTSQSIATTGDGKFQARGQFTLKGRSSNIVVPFSAHRDAARLVIEGSVPISRLAYKVGEGEWSDTGTVADQVQIRFSLYLPL